MAITVRKLETGWAVYDNGKKISSIGGKAAAQLRARRSRINIKLKQLGSS